MRIIQSPTDGVCVQGLTKWCVTSPQEFISKLLLADAQRRVASTHANDRSSRSHTLFQLFIESKCRTRTPSPHKRMHIINTHTHTHTHTHIQSSSQKHTPRTSNTHTHTHTHTHTQTHTHTRKRSDVDDGVVRSSCFTLVDLAGSECVSQLRGNIALTRECKHINKSLLCLSRVILTLAKRSNNTHIHTHTHTHIPYRDSKLTRILKPSLGGNSHTVFVCTVTPTERCRDESLNTIRFGLFARQVINRAKLNEHLNDKVCVCVCVCV